MAPTKLEILEKYRGVILSDDFEILIADDLRNPEEVLKKSGFLQYFVTISGWKVVVYIAGGAYTIIASFGAFCEGLEYMREYSSIAYNSIPNFVTVGETNKDISATKYVITDRPTDWALPPDKPIQFHTTTSTPPPTTTTIYPGSGIAPYSPSWRGDVS